jgi:NhaA family Na+:H+ antiporter
MSANRQSAAARAIQPLREFISTEVSGGAILLAATVTAIVWANSPFSEQYADVFGTRLTIDGGLFRIDEDLRHWINDALMALFFFVVGLEIKREVFRGELQGSHRALLPAIAALGGIVMPALIYSALNSRGAGADGWGIPVATDIAFALGILALLGRRVPPQLRVFLLALAIVDDIGAILIIAVFYSSNIQVDSLTIAGSFLVLLYLMQRVGIQSIPVYFMVGGLVWLAVFESGIHPTIAGVVLGVMTPLDPAAVGFTQRLRRLLRSGGSQEQRIQSQPGRDSATPGADIPGPLFRLEHTLHPVTSFVVIPMFALANAGVSLESDVIGQSLRTSITWGIALGLFAGKSLGIAIFAWIAVRLRIAVLPDDVTWPQVLGVGMLAGVGFTVALFVNELAFDSAVLIQRGKIGILLGSLASGVLGYIFLRMVTADQRQSE